MFLFKHQGANFLGLRDLKGMVSLLSDVIAALFFDNLNWPMKRILSFD